MEKFLLTLTSDSPCEFQKENKCSKFRVHLGQIIELVGKYEVALCEIFYPATLCNIRENECYVDKNISVLQLEESEYLECVFQNENAANRCEPLFKNDAIFHQHIVTYKLKNHYYHTAEEFLSHFNKLMSEFFKCEIDIKTKKIKMDCLPSGNGEEIIYYTLSTTLESIFGFAHGTIFKPGNIYQSGMQFDLRKGIPAMLTVCSDLVGDQIINNGHDKMLRTFYIAPEKYTHGFQKKETFTKIFYLPIVKKKIEYVDIYIKESMTNEASFTHGTLKVVLLFRRIGNE